MSDKFTIRRILTYRGPREWLERTIERSIQGTKFIGEEATISALSIDEFPVSAGPSLMEQFKTEYELAKDYYPDSDDVRKGYLEGVNTCIKMLDAYIKA